MKLLVVDIEQMETIFILTVLSSQRVVFQEYQKIRDKHYRDAGVSALSELSLAPGRFVFVLFQKTVRLMERKLV